MRNQYHIDVRHDALSLMKKSIFFHGRYSAIAIIGLCTFTFIIFFIRCYYHVLSGDELIYTFIWEPDDPTGLWDVGHRFETPALNLTDILQTQIRHYQEVNGRFFMHTFEQLFTNKMLLFSIINSAIFISFIWLITYFVTGTCTNTEYGLWLVIIMSLLYLFPYQESLWTSVNYGLNYLWPATLTMGTLIVWKSLLTSTPKNIFTLIAIMLLGFLTGWSNEAYSIGLSGGIFLFYIIRYREFKSGVLILIIPLFLGTLLMAVSPGNIMRFSGEGCHKKISLLWKIIHGVENLATLKVIWLTFAIFLLGLICNRKSHLKTFFLSNLPLITILITTVAFAIVCNSRPHSATFVELCSLLLMLKYLWSLNWRAPQIIFKSVWTIATVVFLYLQIILAGDTIKMFKIHSKMIEDYQHSTDGLIKVLNPPIAKSSAPFIRGGDPTFWASVSNYITGVHGKWQKDATFYVEGDYEALDPSSSFYSQQFRCQGNAPIYHKTGGIYYWLNGAEHKPGDSYHIKFAPRDYKTQGPFYIKLKYAFLPESYCRYENLTWDTITTRYGTAYRVSTPFAENILGFYKKD